MTIIESTSLDWHKVLITVPGSMRNGNIGSINLIVELQINSWKIIFESLIAKSIYLFNGIILAKYFGTLFGKIALEVRLSGPISRIKN